MENNIILNFTLEKYNKKYKNRRHRLLKYTKKQVEDFDKQYGHYILNSKTYNLEFSHYLLKDRTWALINDIYYEIPKPIRFTWFRNLSVGTQALTCIIGVAAITSSVLFPTLRATIWNKGGGDAPVSSCFTVTFDTDGGSGIPSQKVKLNEMAVEPTNPTKAPDLEHNSYTFKEWQLDGTKFVFSTPITHDITLKAKYDSVCWYSDTAYIDGLKEADVGLIRGVTVNNQLHKVRLIGIDHDKDIDDNTLHTTWEFANLISDSEGYSLGYQWHDAADQRNSNQDYPNSSIRKVLCGSGNFASNVYCATKSSTNKDTPEWDTNYTYTSTNSKTILSMLPINLQNRLNPVKKTVRKGTDYKTIANCSDKLFMLSVKEIGSDADTEDEGQVYTYYLNATKVKRIKQQIKGSNDALTGIKTITDKGTIYKDEIYSRAGFNSNAQGEGGYYWLRTPMTEDKSSRNTSRPCNEKGVVSNGGSVIAAYGVAPAFCL